MARTLMGTLILSMTLGLANLVLAQGQGPDSFGPGRLLFAPDVRKELKLSDEQIGKLRDALGRVMADHKDELAKLQQMPQEERSTKIKVLIKDTQKAIAGVLDAKQLKRFQQIQWQIAGMGALLDPDLQKELKLSGEQKKKLDGIFNDANKKADEMAKNREGSPEKFQALFEDVEKKANNVLTDEQKQSLKELKGPKFEFARPAPPPQPKKQ